MSLAAKLTLAATLVASTIGGLFYWLAQAPAARSASDSSPSVVLEPAQKATNGASAADLAANYARASAVASPSGAPTNSSAAAQPQTAQRPLSRATTRTQASPFPQAKAQTITRIAAFESGQNWANYAERLRDNSPLDAEEKYLAARALDLCRNQARKQKDTQRDEFVKALSNDDSQRTRRLEAYEAINANNGCERLEGKISQAEIDKNYQEASQAGDPKARMFLLERQLERTPRDQRALNADQKREVSDAMASGDPAAFRRALQVVVQANGWRPITLEDDTGSFTVNPSQLAHAGSLVACDLGLPCDQTSAELQRACAWQGQCQSGNVDAHFAQFALSPNDYAIAQRTRAAYQQALISRNYRRVGLG